MPHKPTLNEMRNQRDRQGRQVEKWTTRVHALDNIVKADEKMEATLLRKARTTRLCTRAGMLESFLQEPDMLSNDQVMDLLRIAFRQRTVQDALKTMLDKAHENAMHEED